MKFWRELSTVNKLLLIFIAFVYVLLIIFFIGFFADYNQKTIEIAHSAIVSKNLPSITLTPTIIKLTNTPTPTEANKTISIPKTFSSSKILFGIGSQAGPAMDYKLVHEAPVHMLTSWYNEPHDLVWMKEQQTDLIPRLYENHYVVHLITWTDLPEIEFETPHGHACGRPYPVSSQVVDDMKQLAQIYNGNGQMYVSLFTEFPSFTCIDNNWKGNEAYWMSLKDNFRKIKDNFHQYAPNSKVSISWGGWVGLYDDVENQGGTSLFSYFQDILQESDFTSFQAMESDTNVPEINAMVNILSKYGKPIMLSHYKPSNASEEVFNADMNALFSETLMQQLIAKGLFAVSFMDDEVINKSETSYQIVKNGITKYGR